MSRQLNRRDLLKGAAVAGASFALGGRATAGTNTGSPGAAAPTYSGLLGPGDRPFPDLPAGTESFPEIKHIIVLMMENHSFDNHLGALQRPGVDGLQFRQGQSTNSNLAPDGTRVYATPAPSSCQVGYSISQSWDASHRSWNYGANDGFVRQCGPQSMYFYTPEQFPFYYSLASVFPVCDRYFASVMAQTYPNRRFLMAGSAFGLVGDPLPSPSDPNPRPQGFGTVFDMLNAFGITWKDYFSDLPTTGLFPYVILDNPSKLAPVAEFFVDCAAGNLPAFCMVETEYQEASEENPQDAQLGAYFAFSVIDALMRSPCWKSSLLILNFDEHGGYYDHVPPQPAVRPDGIVPEVGTDTYGDLYSWTGFRVPAVVVSPWARQNYVSHTLYDHTSVLRLVETKWNLPALSARDANANNMLDCLDFSRPAFLVPPALPPAVVPGGALSCIAADPTAAVP